MQYNHKEISEKCLAQWKANQTYKVDNDTTKPKYYVLDMFPYPSGAGLHVGHPLGYIASDIYSRYKKLKGFNVLHPMGYDAFGLPAEQYALSMGVHPGKSTADNIARYREQLDNLGFSYDWDREVQTSDPEYYKWTQWIFIQLFEHYYDPKKETAIPIADMVAHFNKNGSNGIDATASEELSFSADQWKAMSAKEQSDVLMNYRLAYRKTTFVNWCEQLGTVLANDEVKDGVSERGGFPVERKPMLQWSLRITAYAERLLNDLESLEWTEAMKKMQANWIGRSTGSQLFFDLEGHDEKLEIYTTRADTIFGATFMVLAPEHNLVAKITTADQKQAIDDYLNYVKTRSEVQRMSESKEVTGEFTGAYALNPFNGAKIPVYIGEYVLKDYGTGAIMAVPADDERDQRFAEKYGLDIVQVIDKSMYPNATIEDKLGKMINSDFLNGMDVLEAIAATNERIEEMGIGKSKINYRLRDAIFSRQRYWGEPFPIVYDTDGIPHAIPEEELPLLLPFSDDFKPAASGKSPLARNDEWVNLPNGWRRETDTMPGFAGSSWYFLRYMDPLNKETFVGKEALDYWQDVDFYIGGTEHAVGHLMYSRFWHKFLFDKGLVPTNEPFKRLVNQGMIQGVIEFTYLHKESGVFYSAEKVDPEDKAFARIPVHIDFVTDYGLDSSHLTEEGIQQFKEWRPDYNNAKFNYDEVLNTLSEVGKMSKSKFNVVNPDDVVDKYGADVFRMYEMFLGPIDQAKPWDTKGISGVGKFVRRFWGLFFDKTEQFAVSDEAPSAGELKVLHQTIKKIEDDITRLSFNTCISTFMVASNELSKMNCNKKAILEPMLKVLAPFAPFMTEELWSQLGHNGSIHHETFPLFEEKYVKEDAYEYPIMIAGKMRAKIKLPLDMDQATVQEKVLADENVIKWVDGKPVKRFIFVPKKIVNIVV